MMLMHALRFDIDQWIGQNKLVKLYLAVNICTIMLKDALSRETEILPSE